MNVQLDSWIQAIGIVGYAMSVSLAILWAGIAIAYIRAGMSKRVWLMFIVGMIGYAIVFGNLVFIATDPLWVNRVFLSVSLRIVAILAATALWAYSILALNGQWKHENDPSK